MDKAEIGSWMSWDPEPLPPPLSQAGLTPWENDETGRGAKTWAHEFDQPPTFTIVTPCFNAADFIEKTIRSVLWQRYPRIQWFVMDAGSKDGTVEIIKYYERYFERWISEKDEGQSDALNKGFSRATGDILCWLNADDLFLPGALHAVAETWLKNDRPDLIVADADLVDTKMTHIHHQDYRGLSVEKLIDYRKNYLIQPGVFFSLRAWREFGPLDTHLHYAMDFDLFYRIMAKFPPVHCAHKVAYSVFHADCKTVRDRVFSIIETALLQAKFGRFDIAERELVEIGKEHKFLENHFHARRKSKKVLFVITELGLGGAQTFLLRLLRDFAKQHEVFLYVHFKHTLTLQFVGMIPSEVTMLTRLNLSEPHALLAMAQALRVEVVFSHLFHADRLCAAAFGGTSIPLILTDHGDFKIVDKIGLASVDEIREVLETAHTIIATSDIGAESFARFGPDVTQRLTKIPLGVDPASPPTRAERDLRRRALGVRPGAVVFVCAARGVHEKGWSELYTVFRGASARAKTPLELWCLGAGVAIDEIKSRAILEGASNVRFFGFQRNVQDYMVAADCVVLLSKFTGETLNLSLMEAIAHGLPVIASDIGAISETVGKGAAGAGILIPISKETKAAELAAATDAMVEMADDPAVRERFAAAARRRAEMFDMRRISRQTLELMDWVLEGPRARSSTTKAG